MTINSGEIGVQAVAQVFDDKETEKTGVARHYKRF